ncbi:geranylgeranyl reductase [Acinetobacter pittii]|uniref:LexA family protein n=1 Tax=Acinetobacter pittii TaxID=48296 RepID=UPI0007EB71F1|nr:XRE family transcriptional regulator [Acinetobacter pittii]OBA12125.1 geranylgeranyl reductase [Acinetobacter calcoaceticus]OTU47224.1 geranylgeranyl reductase [Acinetobacter pittii]
MNRDTIGQRIRALRRAKKLTQMQLAKIAGVSSPAVTEWEKDSYLPKAGSLEAMANAFGVTTEYILTGKGEIPTQESTNVAPVQARMAPVLSWVQAGNFTNVESVDMSQVLEWFPLPEDCEKCFYLKVRGVSNEPDFIEGDYIVVDPTVHYSDMQSGDIIVVRNDKDATFKKLVIESDGSRFLKAINPNFHPNIIPIDENCYFIGQVIDSMRYTYRAKRRFRKS